MTGLCNLRLTPTLFLTVEYKGTNSDILTLLDLEIRAYCSLQIPVPNFSEQDFVLHHAWCTGLEMFRDRKKRDRIWVGRCAKLD